MNTLKLSVKKILFLLMILGVSIMICLMDSMAKNNNKNFIFFIGIIPIYIFLIILIFVGMLVFKDAKENGLNPWLWSIFTVIFFPAMIGLITYLKIRKHNFDNCNKKIKIIFIINIFLGIISSVLLTLCLTNMLNYLPRNINTTITQLIVFSSPLLFFTSCPLFCAFYDDSKYTINDLFIKSIYKYISFINVIPAIITILIFGHFGY